VLKTGKTMMKKNASCVYWCKIGPESQSLKRTRKGFTVAEII
jgi:hypothetical protein